MYLPLLLVFVYTVSVTFQVTELVALTMTTFTFIFMKAANRNKTGNVNPFVTKSVKKVVSIPPP